MLVILPRNYASKPRHSVVHPVDVHTGVATIILERAMWARFERTFANQPEVKVRTVDHWTMPSVICVDSEPAAAASVRVAGISASCGQITGRHLKHMNALSYWPRNRLLLALPSSNLKQLLPELEHIRCERAQVLMDSDSLLDHVFFPDSGVVSAVAVYADGSIIEMATIGREGCTAVQALLGAKSSSARFLVQIPGGAAKMSRVAFNRAIGSMPSFRRLMYAYVQAFLEQVMVSVACNGAHSLRQRLARWLLMMLDRGDDDTLQITQNLLAEMLGVQRPTITNATWELERAGLIAHGRGQVKILDRPGLVAASCECYQLVRARVAFHLPKTYGWKASPPSR